MPTKKKPKVATKKSKAAKKNPTAVAKKLKAVAKKPKVSKKSKVAAQKRAKPSISNITKNKYLGEDEFLASLEPLKLRKNERYMNKRQKSHFDKILNSWKSLLLIEQDKTAQNLQKSPTNFPDQSDRASQEEEFTLELRTRERERKLLAKIEQSIEELKASDYGYCRSCGIEIGIRRLEARPTATRCIDCKTLEEIKERQNFG
tara:strand:+ start:10686 stop:11294 length:609 start_codon:yes stop_codon:yes gene_type:complete